MPHARDNGEQTMTMTGSDAEKVWETTCHRTDLYGLLVETQGKALLAAIKISQPAAMCEFCTSSSPYCIHRSPSKWAVPVPRTTFKSAAAQEATNPFSLFIYSLFIYLFIYIVIYLHIYII